MPISQGSKHKTRRQKNAKVSLELADEKLLDHGVIRIGIISDAAEKERIRDQLKRALRFVLADTDLAIAYGNSKTVEHLVVPDMAETLKKSPDSLQTNSNIWILIEKSHNLLTVMLIQ